MVTVNMLRVQIGKIIQAMKIGAGSLLSALRIKSMNEKLDKQTDRRAKIKISAQASLCLLLMSRWADKTALLPGYSQHTQTHP